MENHSDRKTIVVVLGLLGLSCIATLTPSGCSAGQSAKTIPSSTPARATSLPTLSAMDTPSPTAIVPTQTLTATPAPSTRTSTATPAPPTRTPTLLPPPANSWQDWTRDYLENGTYARIIESRPWSNSSVNLWQYKYENNLGGVSFWDFFASKSYDGWDEPWNSWHHGWLDGRWEEYREESISAPNGDSIPNYVIVDRDGAGVVDKMVFTQYSVGVLPQDHSPDLAEWGHLAYLGRLRIEVDDRAAFDVPIEDWFSGASLCLPPELARLFFWRYRDFGSNGSIFPIPYRQHIKISVYGGVEKPRWFMITGTTLPPGTPVTTFSGCLDAAAQSRLSILAANVTQPENYINGLDYREEMLSVQPAARPAAASDAQGKIELPGAGTIRALQFRVPKKYTIGALRLRVVYGDRIAIDIPLMAFFGDQDRVVTHRSAPIGIVEAPTDPNAFLFYSNYPLPFQNGIAIEVTTDADPVQIPVKYALSPETTDTQLCVLYDDFRAHARLEIMGPDYEVKIPGDGKLVGLVLVTRDVVYDPKLIPPAPYELVRGWPSVWPLGYMEGNVTMQDGVANLRIYSGLEDFADGGYNFASLKNLPFAGMLAYQYQPPETGYITVFRYLNDISAFRFRDGLMFSFQHGTYANNFPVRYGVTAYYYAPVSGR